MKISEAIQILNRERSLKRTPKGRSMSEYATECIEASLQDSKNYESNIVECLGCGFIFSSLLSDSGCPNCGVIDLTENVIDK